MRPVNTITFRQVGAVKFEKILAWEWRASTFVWRMARDACTVFHWNPRNRKSVDGMRLDFSQWMMKPTSIRGWRASSMFSRQMLYEGPRIRMLSM
jgi:hypothetical protein